MVFNLPSNLLTVQYQSCSTININDDKSSLADSPSLISITLSSPTLSNHVDNCQPGRTVTKNHQPLFEWIYEKVVDGKSNQPYGSNNSLHSYGSTNTLLIIFILEKVVDVALKHQPPWRSPPGCDPGARGAWHLPGDSMVGSLSVPPLVA